MFNPLATSEFNLNARSPCRWKDRASRRPTPCIKGQSSTARVMSAVPPRRAAIEEALQACPTGRWVRLDDFSRFMRAADHVFAVAHDLWKLYLCERQYGSLGYDGSHGWNILQDRYMAAVLFEYAVTLGMVDVSYFDPAQGMMTFGTCGAPTNCGF